MISFLTEFTMRATMLLSTTSTVSAYTLMPALNLHHSMRASVKMAMGGERAHSTPSSDVKMFQGYGWTSPSLGIDESSCEIIYTKEPVEDPMYSCWLVDSGVEGDLEYQCILDHPCIDFEDEVDHADDSY